MVVMELLIFMGIYYCNSQESMQEEMKRIKSKQNETMDMYHVACKEASLAAK